MIIDIKLLSLQRKSNAMIAQVQWATAAASREGKWDMPHSLGLAPALAPHLSFIHRDKTNPITVLWDEYAQ